MANAKKKYVLVKNVRFKGKRYEIGGDIALSADELAQFPEGSLKEKAAEAPAKDSAGK